MTKPSRSPNRHTFQVERYIKRCKDKGEEPREDYMNFFKKLRQLDEENMDSIEWKKDNMEYDLCNTGWILEKARTSDTYAQNLYAAICNNDFTRNDVWPILKGEIWSASWRSAGGIIADMRQEGDYIDWYCSGIGGGLGNGDTTGTKNYVGEGIVTDEIRQDLLKLGWIVVENTDGD